MKNVQREVEKLLKEYNTNDPKKLCDLMGIRLVFSEMGRNISGFTQMFEDISIIHINSFFDEDIDFTIAHELCHALYHREYSTYFLKRTGYRAVDKLEHEANEFATLLLASRFDCSCYECVTINDIMRDCNIPENYEEYLYNYDLNIHT